MVSKGKSKNSAVANGKAEKKQTDRYAHLKQHVIKPGQVLNPAGRPKGSRNKLGEAFLADLLADWENYGAFALADCRKEDPARYCAIVASILPKELDADDEERVLEKFLAQFNTVEDVHAFRAQLQHLSAEQSVAEKGNKTNSRSKPDRV